MLALRGVLALDPDTAKAHELLGLVELRLGHWSHARDASRQAVEHRGGLVRAWNNLGVALYQLGEFEGALDAWRQAVDREPDFWDALWNLGLKAAERGHPELARPALQRFLDQAPPGRYAADRERARVLLAQLGRSREPER